MHSTLELNAAMESKLKALGIGFETIRVFGAIRQNVHVTCISRNTADKWVSVLAKVFKGTRVSCVPTAWEAAENKGGGLNPTMRKGWLIALAA